MSQLLFAGHFSDKKIVARSGFLNLPFDRGDSVMADKGFTVEHLLLVGASLNIPPFGKEGQMSPEEVVATQSFASLCIHVERGINKIKNVHIWDSVVPFTMFGVVNQNECGQCVLCYVIFKTEFQCRDGRDGSNAEMEVTELNVFSLVFKQK